MRQKYHVNVKELEILEKCDTILMARGLASNTRTSTVIMYLEIGWTPIRFLIKSRRVMFLFHLLNENSMLSKFFQAQLNSPLPNDWVITVR